MIGCDVNMWKYYVELAVRIWLQSLERICTKKQLEYAWVCACHLLEHRAHMW